MHLDRFLTTPQSILYFTLVLVGIIWGVLTMLIRALKRREHVLEGSVKLARGVILPAATLVTLLVQFGGFSRADPIIRIMATAIWFTVIWVGMSFIKHLLIRKISHPSTDEGVPRLFIDLVRAVVGVFSVLVVIALVWERDLSQFIATLGIGSLVVGLALQDTLGNFFAGIALFFERPFRVGHWIRVGDVVGQVIEMNWRAVRLQTGQRDLVIVPNSVLGKERIENYSYPSNLHGGGVKLEFSYKDPPDKVKQVLEGVAKETRGVLQDPPPSVKTSKYGEFAIQYEVKFFVDDYSKLAEVSEEILSRAWYVAKKNSLSIPYPIQPLYKGETTQ